MNLIRKLELIGTIILLFIVLAVFVSLSYKIDFVLTLEMFGIGTSAIVGIVIFAKINDRERRSADRVIVEHHYYHDDRNHRNLRENPAYPIENGFGISQNPKEREQQRQNARDAVGFRKGWRKKKIKWF